MHLDLFLRSLAIGFSIAAPVGPIGILCIRRSLTAGWLVGLFTGLGAATADAIYGSITGFGLTMISDFLLHQAIGLKLLGGIFLCYLGLKTGLSHPATPPPALLNPREPQEARASIDDAIAPAAGSQQSILQRSALQRSALQRSGDWSGTQGIWRLASAYGSTLVLTLTNPATIMAFVAIFAGLGLVTTADRASAIVLVSGVFCGSALWWLSLSSGVTLLRGWFTPNRFIWLNRISGLILLAFGIIAISSAVR